MARRPLFVGATTAAIETLYFQEPWMEGVKLGAVSAGATAVTNYVGPMVGIKGRGVDTLVASALYAVAAPRLVDTAEEQSFTTRLFTSVASHIGAGIADRVILRGTIGHMAHEVSTYSPALVNNTDASQP